MKITVDYNDEKLILEKSDEANMKDMIDTFELIMIFLTFTPGQVKEFKEEHGKE